MRDRRSKVGAVLARALVLVVLIAASACGDSEDTGDTGSAPDTRAATEVETTAAPTAPPTTQPKNFTTVQKVRMGPGWTFTFTISLGGTSTEQNNSWCSAWVQPGLVNAKGYARIENTSGRDAPLPRLSVWIAIGENSHDGYWTSGGNENCDIYPWFTTYGSSSSIEAESTEDARGAFTYIPESGYVGGQLGLAVNDGVFESSGTNRVMVPIDRL